MRRVPVNHRVLGRSIVGLDPPSLPLNSIPVVGPIVTSLTGDGGDGASQPTTSQPAQPPASSTDSGGNGGGNKGGGGGGPGFTASPTSGGGNTVPPAPNDPNPTPIYAPGKPSSSSVAESTSGSSINSSGPSSGGNLSGSSGEATPMNIGSVPSATHAAFGASVPSALASGLLSPSQVSGFNLATGTPLPTISTAAAVLSGKKLSGGAIAGITILCLLFLVTLTVLVVRRRSIAQRMELRKQWWFSRSGSGYRSNSGNLRNPMGSNRGSQAGRLSARSSFATNFDQGLMFRTDSPSSLSAGIIPDSPPMAEVHKRNPALISTGGSLARMESMNSLLSNGSDTDVQYLTLSTGKDNPEPSTSMSVRPFSPSESFAFPKPPVPLPPPTVGALFAARSLGPMSPQSSTATPVYLSTPPRVLMGALPSGSNSASASPQISTPSLTLPAPNATAIPPIDPFSDPVKPEFSLVEFIHRPFVPSLDDELVVRAGDRVQIFKIFNDGWAFVEKLTHARDEHHERGLIPVDCFREITQALPTFLTEERGGYGSDELTVTAL